MSTAGRVQQRRACPRRAPGQGALSITEESWMSRMADASTMFLTRKRLMALSLATSTPDDSHLTRLTCTGACALLSRAPPTPRLPAQPGSSHGPCRAWSGRCCACTTPG